MSPKTKVYWYLQVVPASVFTGIVWYRYAAEQFMKSGTSDLGLLLPTLLLFPVLYLILPAFFLLDLYGLWKMIRTKDYGSIIPVATGLLLIAATVLLFLTMPS